MTNPSILGRQEEDDETGQKPDARASTTLVHTVTVPFEAGAVGEVTVSAFRSTDDEDRGGVVLRLTLADKASSFVPYAKLIPSGVEVHIAGDVEAKSLIQALKTALATL